MRFLPLASKQATNSSALCLMPVQSPSGLTAGPRETDGAASRRLAPDSCVHQVDGYVSRTVPDVNWRVFHKPIRPGRFTVPCTGFRRPRYRSRSRCSREKWRYHSTVHACRSAARWQIRYATIGKNTPAKNQWTSSTDELEKRKWPTTAFPTIELNWFGMMCSGTQIYSSSKDYYWHLHRRLYVLNAI
jgi:hypothetical protein